MENNFFLRRPCLCIITFIILLISGTGCKYDNQILLPSTPCDTTIVTFSGTVQPILFTYCIACHSGPNANNGIRVDDYISVKMLIPNGKLLGTITHSPGFSPMPLGGNKLSECNIAKSGTGLQRAHQIIRLTNENLSTKTMIKKQIIAICISCFFIINTTAQIFITRNGRITFFSKTPIENIDARNNEVTSILNTKKGEFVYIVLIKGFKFKKALMEEHFNENYLQSNLFPKAIFKGVISDLDNFNFSKEGIYPVTVKGDLTLHGVTKNIEVPGTISIAGGIINVNSNFNINLKDYKIKVPAIVVNNIAESINITVDCKYVPFKKG